MTCPAALCLARLVSIPNTRRQKSQSCEAVMSSVHGVRILSPHRQPDAHAWIFDQAMPLIRSAGLPQSHGHLTQVAVEMRGLPPKPKDSHNKLNNTRPALWPLADKEHLQSCPQKHPESVTTCILTSSERKSHKLRACLPLPARGQTDALRDAKLGHQGRASKATTAAPGHKHPQEGYQRQLQAELR